MTGPDNRTQTRNLPVGFLLSEYLRLEREANRCKARIAELEAGLIVRHNRERRTTT